MAPRPGKSPPSARGRSSFPTEEFTGFRTAAWKDGVPERPEDLVPRHPTLLHALVEAASAATPAPITLLHESGGARADPDDPLSDLVAEERDQRALHEATVRLAAGLRRAGLRPGDRVCIVLPTGFEFLASFFAALYAGGVPVPTYPPAVLERAEQALERLAYVARHAGSRLCVTSRRIRPLLGALAGDVEQILAVETLGEEGADQPRPHPRSEDAALIQYTSGSTGRPRGVELTHRNLVSNIHVMGQALRITRHDTLVSWLPLYHDMGLIGAFLSAVYWQMPLVLMSPTLFLARPARWLWALSRFRGTISPAPNFAYALAVKRVPAADRVGLDLGRWRLALNGAEPVNPHTLAEFEDTYAPYGFAPDAMLPVYGLAEVSLAAAFPPLGTRARREELDRAALSAGRAVVSSGGPSVVLVGVGRAVPAHEVVVVDEHGTPAAERTVGHIVVRGPSVMRGYFNDPAASAEVLRGDALWTGDLGYLAEGDLFVTGRAKDLIIVDGKNHHAEDLERVAGRVPGARPGGVAAFGVYDEATARDTIVLVCETRVVDEAARVALVRAIGVAVGRATGVAIDEVVLAAPGTVPKTPSGKPQRSRCRELYLADELDQQRTSRLRLAYVLARSGASFLASGARRWLGTRKPPPRRPRRRTPA